MDHRRRPGREPKRKSPFIVPTSRSASPSRTERPEDVGVLSFLAGISGAYGKRGASVSLEREPASPDVLDLAAELLGRAGVDDHVVGAPGGLVGGHLRRDPSARVLLRAAARSPAADPLLLGRGDEQD